MPDKASANPDNFKLERQLDEAGRWSAIAMGAASRDLKIPIGEVFSSPTYRAAFAVTRAIGVYRLALAPSYALFKASISSLVI